MNKRSQAIAQYNQLKASEALGGALAQKMVKSINDRAIAAARKKGKAKFSAAEVAAMQGQLADLMTLAFVRRYRAQKRSLGIQLAFSDQVATLARGLDLDIPGIRNQFNKISGKRLTESIRFIEDKVNRALIDTTVRQQPTKIAVRNMRRSLEDMGLSAAKPGIVETLVRTHSQMAFNAAQYQLEQDDDEDLITGYQYFTVGDDRVREEHDELEGVIFEKDDPRLDEFWPPNGWNCRCQLVALTDPVKATKIPRGVRPDDGFDFNPGQLLDDEE